MADFGAPWDSSDALVLSCSKLSFYAILELPALSRFFRVDSGEYYSSSSAVGCSVIPPSLECLVSPLVLQDFFVHFCQFQVVLLANTSNFRQEIRYSSYRNDPMKYDHFSSRHFPVADNYRQYQASFYKSR